MSHARANQTAVPRRPCRQPDPARCADRGADGGGKRRDAAGRADPHSARRDPRRGAAAGGDRAETRHRRRIQSLFLAARFPAQDRQRQADGIKTHGAVSFCRRHPRARAPAGVFVYDFKFLKSVAKATPKIPIPSPTIVHFRGGREAIDAKAYPEMDAFYDDLAEVYRAEIRDLAEAGCRFLQIDEVNLAYLCDPELRRQVANIGEDPATLPKTYARLLNAVLAGKPDDMTVCMHLCRGNFAGAWIADGGYEPIAELLFNAIGVDGYFLEYDSARAGGFEPLRFLPKGKIAVLGLVTTKSPQMETKDELKHRIDEASRYAPLEQLALSPQCGFSSGIGGNAMTVDDEIRKLALVVETAREVWGTA